VKSVDELRRWPAAIAVIHFSMFVDHYVTVLHVDDDTVTVADPWAGKETLKRADFEKKWNHAAILLDRKKVES
jgi:predicted double-glycine peptidase